MNKNILFSKIGYILIAFLLSSFFVYKLDKFREENYIVILAFTIILYLLFEFSTSHLFVENEIKENLENQNNDEYNNLFQTDDANIDMEEPENNAQIDEEENELQNNFKNIMDMFPKNDNNSNSNDSVSNYNENSDEPMNINVNYNNNTIELINGDILKRLDMSLKNPSTDKFTFDSGYDHTTQNDKLKSYNSRKNKNINKFPKRQLTKRKQMNYQNINEDDNNGRPSRTQVRRNNNTKYPENNNGYQEDDGYTDNNGYKENDSGYTDNGYQEDNTGYTDNGYQEDNTGYTDSNGYKEDDTGYTDSNGYYGDKNKMDVEKNARNSNINNQTDNSMQNNFVIKKQNMPDIRPEKKLIPYSTPISNDAPYKNIDGNSEIRGNKSNRIFKVEEHGGIGDIDEKELFRRMKNFNYPQNISREMKFPDSIYEEDYETNNQDMRKVLIAQDNQSNLDKIKYHNDKYQMNYDVAVIKKLLNEDSFPAPVLLDQPWTEWAPVN